MEGFCPLVCPAFIIKTELTSVKCNNPVSLDTLWQAKGLFFCSAECAYTRYYVATQPIRSQIS